ncbi:hypothetical protein LNQ03_33090 [Klebsiella pneumoniae subsp. pneumoniae]|nr:hypothetical protein [Klebsiella pneumoniae subsp. pneumoniae]
MAAQHIEHSGLQAGSYSGVRVSICWFCLTAALATHRNPPVDPLRPAPAAG